MTLAPLLRTLGVAICVAGAVDPSWVASRDAKPDVSLLVSGRVPDPALADRVARVLERDFTVVRGPSLGASAIVTVGFQLPPENPDATAPAFAVLPEPSTPFVWITSVRAPTRVQMNGQAPIVVSVAALAADGQNVTVSLEQNGVSVDRFASQPSGDDAAVTGALHVAPAVEGDATFTIAATVEGGARADRVPVTVTAADDRWPVLFFDARPSWMSTFVRRAVEGDARFVVTSRVATSRGAAARAGDPPPVLSSLPPLELFRTVVAGAPGDLSAADVAGLDAFMREAGGSVVLLIDAPDTGRPFERLTGVDQWRASALAEPAGAPLASEFLRPAARPSWLMPVEAARPEADEPVIWQMAVGPGKLVISGALDAWRYRDRDSAAFDRTWRLILGEASTVAAGDAVDRAGMTPNRVRSAEGPVPDERPLLRAWTASRGGATLPESRLADLSDIVRHAVQPVSESRAIHPMASAWWIVPLGLALGGEWWLRRRSGRR